MTTNVELLPCPFCGGTNVGEDWVETYSVDSSYAVFGCRDCGARYEDGGPDEWNRRYTAPPPPDAALRDAAKALAERLRAIHEHPLYQAVWHSAWNHGINYTNGPNYTTELEVLEAILSRQPAQGEQPDGVVVPDAVRWQTFLRECVGGGMQFSDGKWMNADEPISEWNAYMDMLEAASRREGEGR